MKPKENAVVKHDEPKKRFVMSKIREHIDTFCLATAILVLLLTALLAAA